MTPTFVTDPAEQYLALNWDWHFRRVLDDGDVYWEATIGEIPDFSVFGESKPEVAANAREGLLSHLRGYLVTGKPIPVPGRLKIASYEPDRRVALAGV